MSVATTPPATGTRHRPRRDPWFTLLSRRAGLPAPVVPLVRRTRSVQVPLHDGVVTLADHWAPVGVTQAPLVLVRTPYGRRPFNLLVARTLAHQGFQVLVQACRGTDGSGGRFDDPFVCEVEDGAATVRWLTAQDFYPGSFLTFGDSYLGWNQLALMEAAGEHLAGAVLRVAPSSLREMFWKDDALAFSSAYSWTVMAARDPRLTLRNLLRARRQASQVAAVGRSAPLTETYRRLTPGAVGFWEDWMTHTSDDRAWWQRGELGHVLEGVQAPVLVQGGWYDLFLEDSLGQYARLAAQDAPVELQLGPWSHGDMLSKALGATMTDAVRWLREVAGLEARIPQPAPVRLAAIGGGPDLALPAWPAPAGPPAVWHLAPGRLTRDPQGTGASGTDGTTSFTYDPADPTPSVGGATNQHDAGAADNTALEARPDVVTFTSEPLAEDLTVLGAATLTLTHGSDRDETALFVRLCEVTAQGRSVNVTDRHLLLRAADRRPDGTWDLAVTLPPTFWRVPRGHRVRLQVSGGAFPRFTRHPGSTVPAPAATEHHRATHVLHHSGQHPAVLTLPTLGVTA